jgi:chaperonin GroEL
LPDRVEDAGAMMMRHTIWNIRDEVGDGSATGAVIARAVAREMQRMVVAGCNAMILRRGIEKGLKAALTALDEMAIPLEGEDRIAAVATAASGDPEIGRLLGEMFDVLGPNAHIVIEPYTATFHDRAYREGTRFKGGYVSPYLANDTLRRLAIMKDVHVVAADMAFDSIDSIQHVLELVLGMGGKSVLIVCRSVSDQVISVMATNNERGTLRSCAVKSKEVGEVRLNAIRNLALVTGGVAMSDKEGLTPKRIKAEHFGFATRTIASRDELTVIGGRGDKAAIRQRAKELKAEIRRTRDQVDRDNLRRLLHQLSEGIGELRIGALTETERKSLTEIAEIAIKTVSAGMEGGIVPGGGAAYLNCIPAVEAVEAKGDEATGVQIVARVLEEPMRQIVSNAGFHPPIALANARKAGPGYGFDVRSEEIVDMIAEGIADSTFVAREALRRGVSAGIMLLTTDTLVLHRKPKESVRP